MKQNLLNDIILQNITAELIEQHGCHTVILYGSRARGDSSEISDYDIAGVGKNIAKNRIARKVNGVFLDLLIFPEQELNEAKEEYLFYMGDGVVLFEKEDWGTNFLKKLTSFMSEPIEYNHEQIEHRKIWYQKKLSKTEQPSFEGSHARFWILCTVLEDYFRFRRLHFNGPKNAIQHLKNHDKNIYSLYEKALANPFNQGILFSLVKESILDVKY